MSIAQAIFFPKKRAGLQPDKSGQSVLSLNRVYDFWRWKMDRFREKVTESARSCFTLALTLAFAVSGMAFADTWYGKVVSVQSGDVLTIKKGRRNVRIHLVGIEAPQRGQLGFRDSRANLADFCRSRHALVSADLSAPGIRDGQIACKWDGGYADMAQYQVDQGWAWLQPATTDPDLVAALNSAQAHCFGIWARMLPGCQDLITGGSSRSDFGMNAGNNSGYGSDAGTNTTDEFFGRTYYNGPRGGCYYLSSKESQVYVDHSFCGR